MNKETAIPLTKTLLRRIIGKKSSYKSGGSTMKSHYCYSVWLRHLHYWNKHKDNIPEVIAELGPGNSIGIGLAALISGSKQLHTLDVVKYWNTEQNLARFDELVELFKTKSRIPGNDQFQKIKPELEDYEFPNHILTDEVLSESLNKKRLDAIRSEILDIDNPNNTFIKCHIPWKSSNIIKNGTLDFIYSQSVLQYIEDMNFTFDVMKNWLKPKGLMSHSIDLSSIGITKKWNGHWTFNDLEWNVLKNDRQIIINRKPLSYYYKQHENFELKILMCFSTEKENTLNKNNLNSKFKNFSEKDLVTSDVYFLSEKVQI